MRYKKYQKGNLYEEWSGFCDSVQVLITKKKYKTVLYRQKDYVVDLLLPWWPLLALCRVFPFDLPNFIFSLSSASPKHDLGSSLRTSSRFPRQNSKGTGMFRKWKIFHPTFARHFEDIILRKSNYSTDSKSQDDSTTNNPFKHAGGNPLSST